MEENNKKNKSSMAGYAKYSGLAVQMIAVLLICYFIGNKIDKYYNNDTPYVTAGLMLFGVFAIIYITIKSLKSDG